VGSFEGKSLSCSLIGSFRKHYAQIVEVADEFRKSGIDVLSPKPGDVRDPNNLFVYLSSDNRNLSPAEIQLQTFERIFKSSFVYVVNIGGYVGKTTCYEIGRIVEKGIPFFFAREPEDLPLLVPKNSVLLLSALIDCIETTGSVPTVSFNEFSDRIRKLHCSTLNSNRMNGGIEKCKNAL
jgi:hypothetical protein